MTSVDQWERASEQSLREARRRRKDRPHAHPWPQHGEWAWALLAALLVIILGYGLLIGLALIAPPVT